jgi:zona occludens toxin (predicted ATPase)
MKINLANKIHLTKIILSTVYINKMSTFLQQLKKGLSKWFEPNRIIFFVIVILLCVALLYYSNSKVMGFEGIEDGSTTSEPTDEEVLPSPIDSADSYTLSPTANPVDLLPKDANNQWTSLNNLNGSNINMPDLLQSGIHIGLDTVGQSLRNANLQERSDPIIPAVDTGPWNKSTIEPDYGRVPLNIGECSR